MHFPGFAAYCVNCRLRREVCLCAGVQRANVDIRLIVVLHAVEALKMSNTGHLAKLVIPDCSVVTHGARGRAAVDLSELEETHAPDGAAWRTILFFPGLEANPLTAAAAAMLRAPTENGEATRLRIIIPDGTWSQARRMVKRVPALAALPRYILPASETLTAREAMRPRGNPEPYRVSTCEAIAAAFGALGETAAEAALFDVYDAAALRIALMRGKLPLKDHRHVLVGGDAGDVRSR